MNFSKVDSLVDYHPSYQNGKFRVIMSLNEMAIIGNYDHKVVIAAMLQESVESMRDFERKYLSKITLNGITFYLWNPGKQEATELRYSHLAEAAKWNQDKIKEILGK